jgi:hypothetical protein
MNLFKIYSNDDSNIINSTGVKENLNEIYTLLEENITRLSKNNLTDLNTDLTSEDINEINIIFNFNIVDLMPLDTFRGCINSLLFTMPDNTVIMPITIDNYISQMIDSMALDTGVQYLSLSFQTPNLYKN